MEGNLDDFGQKEEHRRSQTLQYMGCTCQVMKHVASQRSDEERATYMAEISKYDPAMIISTDETGCDGCHSTRKCSYSIRGLMPKH